MVFVEALHLCVGQALKIEQQELRKATMVRNASASDCDVAQEHAGAIQLYSQHDSRRSSRLAAGLVLGCALGSQPFHVSC